MNDDDDPKNFSDFYENLQKWSLDRKNLPYFGKSAKNFFLPEKNPTSIFKIGGIFEKKIEIPIGRRPFFESMSEAKCHEKALANLEKPLANECGRRVHPTATPLPWNPRGEAEWSWPPYLPPSRKSFFDFYENLQKWSLDRKNLPYFGKSAKNFFLLEKNPTSSFKIGGIFGKKCSAIFLKIYRNKV